MSASPDDTTRSRYHINIDPLQEDKGTEIKLKSFARPHMRAFHCSWFSFFLAFTGWFCLAPLMPTIKKDLGLTKSQVADANIASVASTVFFRYLLGPTCDKFGARNVMVGLLLVGSIPIYLAGLADSPGGLVAVRFCIGIIGASFVCCQFWTSVTFTKEVVGAANALAGGWGNLGAGFTFILMPLVFDAFVAAGVHKFNAWRYAVFVPATLLVLTASFVYFKSDDCPTGSYQDLQAKRKRDRLAAEEEEAAGQPPAAVEGGGGAKKKESGMGAAFTHPIAWILALHYAASFGIELTINNNIGTYLFEDFHKDGCNPKDFPDDEEACYLLSQTTASLIASLFGLMNLFARASGGFMSDHFGAKERYSMKGRIWVLFGCMIGEGIFLIIFSRIRKLGGAIVTMILFSLFVQAAEGAVFSVVPYVDPLRVGVIAGVVGAGGNIGAVSWGFLLKAQDQLANGFMIIGFIVLGLACLCPMVRLEGQSHMFSWGGEGSMKKGGAVVYDDAKEAAKEVVDRDGDDTTKDSLGKRERSESPTGAVDSSLSTFRSSFNDKTSGQGQEVYC